MAVPPHHFDDEPAVPQPGGLLGELERRQDEVLDKLDDLDAQLSEVLKGLEPATEPTPGRALDQPPADVAAGIRALAAAFGDEAEDDGGLEEDESDDFESDDFESAEDWA